MLALAVEIPHHHFYPHLIPLGERLNQVQPRPYFAQHHRVQALVVHLQRARCSRLIPAAYVSGEAAGFRDVGAA
jgi:hypothetical protein